MDVQEGLLEVSTAYASFPARACAYMRSYARSPAQRFVAHFIGGRRIERVLQVRSEFIALGTLSYRAVGYTILSDSMARIEVPIPLPRSRYPIPPPAPSGFCYGDDLCVVLRRRPLRCPILQC